MYKDMNWDNDPWSAPVPVFDDESGTIGNQDGMLYQDGIRRFPDGSAVIGETSPVIHPKFTDDFEQNLAEVLPETFLKEMSFRLKEAIEDDIRSQEQQYQQIANLIDIIGFKPDYGASGGSIDYEGSPSIHSTALSEAFLDWTAKIMSSIYPDGGPADTVIEGETDEENEQRAYRIKCFYNKFVSSIDEGFEKELKRAVYWSVGTPVYGKVFIDTVLGRPTFRMLMPQDLIVNRNVSSYLISNRVTQVHHLNKDEFDMRRFMGEYRDVTVTTDTDSGEQNVITETLDQVSGYDSSNSYNRYDSQEYKIYESHVDYKIPLDPYAKNFPIPLSYRIHLDASTGNILRINRNWKKDDPLKKKKNFFVNFSLFPSFDGEGYGLIQYAGQQAHAATTILRMLMTAGMYSSFPGGFYQGDIRFEDNNIRPTVGEFTKLQTGGIKLNDAILPFPYKEPSMALSSLKDQIEDSIKKPAAIINDQVAQMTPRAPMGSVLAMLENLQKVENFVIRGYHKSMQKVFELLRERFIEWLPDGQSYPFLVPGGFHSIIKDDFNSSVQIITSTDPSLQNSSYRLMRAEIILNNAAKFPDIHDMRFANRMFYRNLNINDDEINKLLPSPSETPPPEPLDPVSENANLMNSKPVAVGIMQDHDAHIIVHSLIENDPTQPPEVIAAAKSHIQKHKADKLIVNMFTQMQQQIPQDPSQIDPQTQNYIAQMAAQIAQQELQQQQANQTPQLDPNLLIAQAAQKEAEVKELQVHQKARADEQKFQLDYQKLLTESSLKEKELAIKEIEVTNKARLESDKNQIIEKKMDIDNMIKEKDQLFHNLENQQPEETIINPAEAIPL